MEAGEQDSAGIVAIQGLDQHEIHISMIIGHGLGLEDSAAGDEVFERHFVQIIE